MTKVDFYVLDSSETDDRLMLVCRLAEKAAGKGSRVFVHADDGGLLERLDERLWDFRASSFVAHRLLTQDALPDERDSDPVQLSTGSPGPDRQILINLADEVPPFFSRFERTLEVVDQSATVRDAGRVRYRFYRHRGYPLKHHAVAAPGTRPTLDYTPS